MLGVVNKCSLVGCWVAVVAFVTGDPVIVAVIVVVILSLVVALVAFLVVVSEVLLVG